MIGDVQTDNPWDFPPDNPNPGDPGMPGTPNADPWSADDLAQARAYYQQYMDARGGMGTYGTIDNVLDAYRTQRQQGVSHQDALQGGLGMLGWQNVPLPTSTSTPPTPAPGGGGGGGGAPGGDLTSPWGGGPFAPPTPTPYPDEPTFHQPTIEEAANDPGYQFTKQEGDRNLKSWLSAHGTFNDSSAAEALQQYGQGAAATQYGNVWDRSYKTYQGQLDPWRTNKATVQHDNDQGWQNAFNTWLQNWNIWKDQRDSSFSKRFQVATA